MSVDQGDDAVEDRLGRASLGSFVAIVVILAALGLFVTVFLMFPLGMASDPCLGGTSPALICSGRVQQLVVLLPWAGLGGALGLGLLTGLLSYRRGRSAFVGIGVGAGLYLASVVVACCLAF